VPERILFVHSRKASFIRIDRELLAERWELRDWYQPGRVPNLPALIPAVLRSDLVFGWFASWHTFWPITLAWLFRKPSVLIIGGFDVANMPDIGYGYQRGGLRKWASRWIIHRAGRLVTNSFYSRDEIERNVGLPPERVTVIHHGVPDPFGSLPEGRREPLALTVGHLLRTTLGQKGHQGFVEAAALLPEVRFVLAGKWHDDAIELLRARATENVSFTGWLRREELDDYYRRAAVYVQASRHEGFGLAVAEAMLAGCIPVVTDVTAMPEVVGDAGIKIASGSAADVADGVRRALAADEGAHRRARERVLAEFPLEARARRLRGVVTEALAGEP
jgi:glycosyltransferase involved in cell wall biosynthesis